MQTLSAATEEERYHIWDALLKSVHILDQRPVRVQTESTEIQIFAAPITLEDRA
jgi:hypothetical protein